MGRAAQKPPYVTAARIEEFLALEAKRLELGRQAEDLKKRAEPIKQELLAFVRAKGGIAQSVFLDCRTGRVSSSVSRLKTSAMGTVGGGFRLAIKLAKGQVAWKTEFIARLGQAAADELAASPPLREALEVERTS